MLLAAEITPTVAATVTPVVAAAAESAASDFGVIGLVVQALVAIGTLALAAATFKMVRANQRMVKEMERQRVDAVHPDLVFCQTHAGLAKGSLDPKEVQPVETISFDGPFQVHNFGSGLAQDGVVRFAWASDRTPETKLPPLAPEFWTVLRFESHRNEIRKIMGEALPNEIRLEMEYCDTFRHRHLTILQLVLSDRGASRYRVERVEHQCPDRKDTK